MATILKTTFQLRRGHSTQWAEVNPILGLGEPGFVTDLNAVKVGDGVTPWEQLDYLTGGVFNAETHIDFPSVGSANMIYKAAKEKKTYQWNSEELKYELLNEVSIDDFNIELIHGGTAYGAAIEHENSPA